jgi:tetratricopeptide (TPR) repeat protein
LTHAKQYLAERFEAWDEIEERPRYNIAPTQPVLTVRKEQGKKVRQFTSQTPRPQSGQRPSVSCHGHASEYVPGALSEENTRLGNEAITEYREYVDKHMNDLSAIDGLVSMLYETGKEPFDAKKLEESRFYRERHIALRPNDPEPYYWIGVTNWTIVQRTNLEIRSEYNMAHVNKQIKDTDALPPDVRKAYAGNYGALVDDGIANLEKAIQLKPDYEPALLSLYLLYHRKADMVHSTAEREALLKQAAPPLDVSQLLLGRLVCTAGWGDPWAGWGEPQRANALSPTLCAPGLWLFVWSLAVSWASSFA